MPAIPEAWFNRIKAASRDLVSACGGVERAADKSAHSKSEVSRWQSAKDGSMIPISAALALETECGIPFVTAAMADLNGRRLSDPDGEGLPSEDIFRRHAEVARAFADVIAEGAAAQADGKCTPTEAEVMDRSYATVERRVAEARLALAHAKLQVVR